MTDPCLYCEEPVLALDDQVRVHFHSAEGVTLRRVHRECFLRKVLGSVGHQLGRCSCHGGAEEDPPGLTKREAATAAVRTWTQLQQKPGVA